MLGTHEKLTPQENIEITEVMEREIEGIAKSRGFIGIFTTNTSPLTQVCLRRSACITKILVYNTFCLVSSIAFLLKKINETFFSKSNNKCICSLSFLTQLSCRLMVYSFFFQQLAENILNYKKLKTYQINQYVASDGTRPFKRGTDDLVAVCSFKKL